MVSDRCKLHCLLFLLLSGSLGAQANRNRDHDKAVTGFYQTISNDNVTDVQKEIYILATDIVRENSYTEPPKDTERENREGYLPTKNDTDPMTIESQTTSTENDDHHLSETMGAVTDLPRTQSLPPTPTGFVKGCVCDLLVDHCNPSCCCDPDCNTSEISGCQSLESSEKMKYTEPTEVEMWESTENGTDSWGVDDPNITETKLGSAENDKPSLTVRNTGSSEVQETKALPAPVSNIASLCVCDLLVGQCDVNCCCDSDCNLSDFSLFSGCSVPVVTVDSQLCTQETIQYSITSGQRTVTAVENINPSIFCIQTANYQPALFYITPDVPTANNFDNLLATHSKSSFGSAMDVPSTPQNIIKYEYGSLILTTNSYLTLPAPLGTARCTDRNPVGFLVNQDSMCSLGMSFRSCSNPVLSLRSYTDVKILSTPNSGIEINITVQSISMKSLSGISIPNSVSDYVPTLDNTTGICNNVVLGGNYQIIYTEQGTILDVIASFLLGAVNTTAGPIQQNFKVHFTQNGTSPSPLSGNPGYVAGLPIVAGYKEPQSGIIQNTNRFGQLTILKSSADQNCLTQEGNRAAILFGYNMASGCKLQYPVACQIAAVSILNVLKGQQFPEYVASFGNSQPQNFLDWVPITILISTLPQTSTASCKIPISFDLEVRWTKYGSLVNPQAQIVNVTEKITYAFVPDTNLGSGNFLQISTSVTFLDVSAPAVPGYKVPPTIDAKLPFDFFSPFV